MTAGSPGQMSGSRQYPALKCGGDRFRAIAHLELYENIFDVKFRGVFGEAEQVANLAVAQALDQQRQHVEFAVGRLRP